jgi:hypothetical protein
MECRTIALVHWTMLLLESGPVYFTVSLDYSAYALVTVEKMCSKFNTISIARKIVKFIHKFNRLKAVAVFNILSVGAAVCCAIISGIIGAHIVNDKDKVCNPIQVYPPIFSDSVKVDCKFKLLFF